MTFCKLHAVVLTASLVMYGCSTTANFQHTPTETSDFHKSLPELKQEFSDVQKYDRFFADPADSPTKDELVQLWGTPEIEKRWDIFALNWTVNIGIVAAGYLSAPFLAVVYAAFPMPPENYKWRKGNYEIVALSRNDAFVRYEDRIHRWEWKEVSHSGTLDLVKVNEAATQQ